MGDKLGKNGREALCSFAAWNNDLIATPYPLLSGFLITLAPTEFATSYVPSVEPSS